ncbi:MAG: SH3 domain-containing protein [Pseudomonadota bacterium]
MALGIRQVFIVVLVVGAGFLLFSLDGARRASPPVLATAPTDGEGGLADDLYGALEVDPAPEDARVVRLDPIDEGVGVPGFAETRQAVLAAVEARSFTDLRPHLAPTINTFQEGRGTIDLFRRLLTEPSTGEAYWRNLEDALQFGAVRIEEDGLCAPYFACRSTVGLLDGVSPYNTAVLVDRDVPVYDAPDLASQVVGRLSYQLVELGTYLEDADWIEIRLAGGGEGYVPRVATRSPIGYRAEFVKQADRWLLVALRTGGI